MANRKPLQRSRRNRIVAGICGGIAESREWNPTVVRALYILVSAVSVAFPGILFYIVLWAIVPEARE